MQDPWDPTSNHIAIQTCGPATNTPVHQPGNYTIGNNGNVQSCLLSQQVNRLQHPTAGRCVVTVLRARTAQSISGNRLHAAIGKPGGLASDLARSDVSFRDPHPDQAAHHERPVQHCLRRAKQSQRTEPRHCTCSGQGPCGYAWVGFVGISTPVGAQPRTFSDGNSRSRLRLRYSKVIQPGGMPTVFGFGAHQTTVTYPTGFQNPNGILMNVTATPVTATPCSTRHGCSEPTSPMSSALPI